MDLPWPITHGTESKNFEGRIKKKKKKKISQNSAFKILRNVTGYSHVEQRIIWKDAFLVFLDVRKSHFFTLKDFLLAHDSDLSVFLRVFNSWTFKMAISAAFPESPLPLSSPLFLELIFFFHSEYLAREGNYKILWRAVIITMSAELAYEVGIDVVIVAASNFFYFLYLQLVNRELCNGCKRTENQ